MPGDQRRLLLPCKASFILASSKGPHAIKSINKLAAEYRLKLDEIMKNISDKISECAKTEKQNWSVLDEIEMKVTQMREELHTVTEKQVPGNPNYHSC